MPMVSVVIPTYNRSKFLPAAIESVLAQDFRDFELVVVDDGSDDNTIDIVRCYGDKIKYIYQDNQGVSAARNRGMCAAIGDIIAFLDSDDEWLPAYLSDVATALTGDAGLVAVYTNAWRVGFPDQYKTTFEVKGMSSVFRGAHFVRIDRPFTTVLERNINMPQSFAFRRRYLERAGVFDVKLTIGEDYDFILRVSTQGPFGFLDTCNASIKRQPGDSANLSEQWSQNQIATRRAIDYIYCKILQSMPLDRGEYLALRRAMSCNRRAVGNLLASEGRHGMATESYFNSFRVWPNLKSAARAGVSLINELVRGDSGTTKATAQYGNRDH
jgi:glycosyltransferase involved in cell wall biosynthesis